VLFSVAGGADLGMLEIQDAAAVITNAIDPDAKVIFGAITDETLKKGQVKVTVIATGFPEANMPKASLFSGLTRSAPKTEVKEEPLKKNEIPGVEPEAKDEEVDTTPSTPSTPASNLKDDDDEDEWANLPSFLRRK
jgi:cell division GTPase FtsZ